MLIKTRYEDKECYSQWHWPVPSPCHIGLPMNGCPCGLRRCPLLLTLFRQGASKEGLLNGNQKEPDDDPFIPLFPQLCTKQLVGLRGLSHI